LGQLRNAVKTGGKIGERLGELSKFLQQWVVPLDQDQSNPIPDVMVIVGMSSLTLALGPGHKGLPAMVDANTRP
jgi:hypothetical protein